MYLFEDVMKMRAEKIFIDYAQKKGENDIFGNMQSV